MKRVLCAALLACFTVCISYAQIDTTSAAEYNLQPKDSLFLEMIGYVADQIQPRYKMYQTENIYNLLKLDTVTGAIWQVQYGMNKDAEAMQVAIDSWPLVWSSESHPGRFALYPTKNMYNFILLDSDTGDVYQVQWSTEPKKRFRVKID